MSVEHAAEGCKRFEPSFVVRKQPAEASIVTLSTRFELGQGEAVPFSTTLAHSWIDYRVLFLTQT